MLNWNYFLQDVEGGFTIDALTVISLVVLRPIKARVAMKHVNCFVDDDNSFYVLKYESLII